MTVEEYIEKVSPEARTNLLRLREIAREEAPEAEEKISYGIPTYKFNGFLASIGAFKNHCSFFPGHTVREFEEELKGYKTSRGTVQFPHGKALPEELIRKMIRRRAEENLSAGGDPL